MLDIKRKVCKVGAFCLAGVMAAGVTQATVYAKNNVTEKKNQEIKEKIDDAVNTIWTPTDDESNSKDETVYVLLNADGSTQKVIVSDWIKNNQKQDVLSDTSELADFKAVKDGEEYQWENDKLIWSTGGKDVYYQGSLDKELPVTVSVTYTLDGKEMKAEDLSGKSGHVVIRYEYQDNLYENKEIAGESEKIYVPFALLTGMILDNDQFSNVRVSSGKVLNDGNKSIVTGIAFPGLAESLDLEDLSDSLEIEADVTDFSMGSVYCVATNSIFENLNLDNMDDLSDLTDALDELQDASKQLMDGSSDLYDGVEELYNKSGELKDGVGKLANGAGDLVNGANSLADGAGKLRTGAGQLADGASSLKNGSTSLQSGAQELAAGLNALASRNGQLNGAAAQVFDSLLAEANKQLNALGVSADMNRDNYDDYLNGLLDSLGEANVRAQVTAQVNANEPQIRAAVTAAVRNGQNGTGGVVDSVIANMQAQGYPITRDIYNAAKSGVTVSGGDAGVQAMVAAVDSNADAYLATEEGKQLIEQNVEAQKQQLINENLASQMNAANEGAAKVVALKKSLDDYNTFYQGLLAYTAGVSSASTGAAKLSDGAGQLVNGASQLSNGVGELVGGTDSLVNGSKQLAQGTKDLKAGVDTLNSGSGALIDGISQLKDGAMDLRDGMSTFDEEGISKLAELDDSGIQESIDRLKATVEVGGNYNSFSGISEDMNGSVKFIFKLAEIK